VQYQQSWTPQTINFTVLSGLDYDQIIAKTTFINPGWTVQPLPSIRLVVKPLKRISSHFGLSYTIGTKKLQEWTVVYSKNGIKHKEAKTWIDGSKYGLSVGASILFGKLN
jgi:hypothetical protein